MDASWEKVRRTRPSHNINDNILWKQETQKPADKYFRKARETPGEFVAFVIVSLLRVNRTSKTMSEPESTHIYESNVISDKTTGKYQRQTDQLKHS